MIKKECAICHKKDCPLYWDKYRNQYECAEHSEYLRNENKNNKTIGKRSPTRNL